MEQPVTTRLAYDDVDDATLIPSTARLDGDVLRVEGRVRAGWVNRPLAPGVGRRDVIALVLCIAPVTSWRFSDLNRGTGELLAGEFRPDERGARIRGVVPGDLVVASPSRPSAWFETVAVDAAGRPVVPPRSAPTPFEWTPARRAGAMWGAIGVVGGLAALLGFFGLLVGLPGWDWDWTSSLTVYLDRGRRWPLIFAEAWHYLVPVIVALVLGSVAFVVGTMASINPKRR